MNEDFISSLLATMKIWIPKFQAFLGDTGVFLGDNQLAIKVFCILLSWLLFAGIIYAARKAIKSYIEFRRLTFRDWLGIGARFPRRYLKSWTRIKDNLESQEEVKMRLAVLEADRLLEEIFMVVGYEGETFDERIGFATEAQFKNLNEIKKAHETADKIKKDPDYVIDHESAKGLVDVYEVALKSLYVLE